MRWSAKTAENGRTLDYDGGKKIFGRKRRLLVDTQGTLLKACVHEAGIHDRCGAGLLLSGPKGLFPAIELMWGDSRIRPIEVMAVPKAGPYDRTPPPR
jgi:putative transposase